MRGEDFIEVAKNLTRFRFEASLRSAISRAYYALLNSAAELLIELGFSVQQGPGVHGAIRSRLSNCGIDQLFDFSQTLDELRTERNKADYNMRTNQFQNQAVCALRVAQAEQALGFLSGCNIEPLRSQIRAGIRDYESKIGA